MSHSVELSCGGERCSVCGFPATHKLGEETSDRSRHNLTAYVCCAHFIEVVGQAAPCAEGRCLTEAAAPPSALIPSGLAEYVLRDMRKRSMSLSLDDSDDSIPAEEAKTVIDALRGNELVGEVPPGRTFRRVVEIFRAGVRHGGGAAAPGANLVNRMTSASARLEIAFGSGPKAAVSVPGWAAPTVALARLEEACEGAVKALALRMEAIWTLEDIVQMLADGKLHVARDYSEKALSFLKEKGLAASCATRNAASGAGEIPATVEVCQHCSHFDQVAREAKEIEDSMLAFGRKVIEVLSEAMGEPDPNEQSAGESTMAAADTVLRSAATVIRAMRSPAATEPGTVARAAEVFRGGRS